MTRPTARLGGRPDWLLIFRIINAKATLLPIKGHGDLMLRSQAGEISIDPSILTDLARRGLIRREGATVILTQTGENLIPNRETGMVVIAKQSSDGAFIASHLAESPLLVLCRHKDATGKPFLDAQQFDAGERLRADFTLGQLSPRITANWQASVSSGRRAGSAGGVEALTNSALAARQRFENAICTLSQDLSGAVLDICCFLKGLEQVEVERRWPKRSAKFMLRAGLSMLEQHYNPVGGKTRGPIRSWGSDDYRPSVS